MASARVMLAHFLMRRPSKNDLYGRGILHAQGHVCIYDSIYSVPKFVPVPMKATRVTFGGEHMALILQDGSVWCWGNNESGQLYGN